MGERGTVPRITLGTNIHTELKCFKTQARRIPQTGICRRVSTQVPGVGYPGSPRARHPGRRPRRRLVTAPPSTHARELHSERLRFSPPPHSNPNRTTQTSLNTLQPARRVETKTSNPVFCPILGDRAMPSAFSTRSWAIISSMAFLTLVKASRRTCVASVARRGLESLCATVDKSFEAFDRRSECITRVSFGTAKREGFTKGGLRKWLPGRRKGG